jgi:hypothetical protein
VTSRCFMATFSKPQMRPDRQRAISFIPAHHAAAQPNDTAHGDRPEQGRRTRRAFVSFGDNRKRKPADAGIWRKLGFKARRLQDDLREGNAAGLPSGLTPWQSLISGAPLTH